MTTGLTVVSDALIAAGIAAQGDPIPPEDSSLALRILNRMMDSSSNEAGMIYALRPDTFTMVAGQQAYSSTSFASALRPVHIDSLIVSLSNIDYPVEIIDTESFQNISYKPVNSIPQYVTITAAMPVLTLDFWPRPYAAFVCTLQVFTPLISTISEITVLSLPPGYEDWIVSNLSIRCANSWRRPVTPDMRLQARNARMALKRANYEPPLMEMNLGGTLSQVTNALITGGWR